MISAAVRLNKNLPTSSLMIISSLRFAINSLKISSVSPKCNLSSSTSACNCAFSNKCTSASIFLYILLTSYKKFPKHIFGTCSVHVRCARDCHPPSQTGFAISVPTLPKSKKK